MAAIALLLPAFNEVPEGFPACPAVAVQVASIGGQLLM
jgi:hypothetical protein